LSTINLDTQEVDTLAIAIVQLLLVVGLVVPALAQDKGWERQWNEILAAARKEGKVVVLGSADPVVRRELPAKFKARFGITVEYIGGRGGENQARVNMERRAGAYTTDVVMAGMDNMAGYYNDKLLDPLLPLLILPEVVDPSKWKKGKLWFMDPEEKYILRLYNYASSGLFAINTQHAKPEEFKSIKDLLNVKWKGKISVNDPTISGTGEGEATRYYFEFGEDFVKRLYIDQKPTFSRDKRQIADWLGRGTYPVSLSAESELVLEMKKEGLPVEIIEVSDRALTVTAGNGILAIFNKGPHPNATRVFVNWLTSKEGMEFLGRARNKPTTRNDIDESFAIPWEVPRPGMKYFDTYEWDYITRVRAQVSQRIKELLAAR
jgi:iron(III) transport system substrate-binding protein